MNEPPPNPYAPPMSATANVIEPAVYGSDAIPAGFGLRFAGRLIDFVVTFLVSLVSGAIGGALVVVLAMSGAVDANAPARLGEMSGGAFALSFLGTVLYHTLCEGIGGASIGKLVLGLRVRRETLEPCSIGAALGRSLAYFIDSFCFGLPAYSSMSSSPMRQRYGDKWAHTVVVKASSLGGVPARGSQLAIGIVAAIGVLVVVDVASVVMKAF